MKLYITLFITVLLSACNSNPRYYSNSYSNSVNDDKNAEIAWHNCYKNVSGSKIDLVETQLIPTESLVGSKKYQEIKNLDKKITPLQKEALETYNKEISWCDKVFVDSISNTSLKNYVKRTAQHTENLRWMLIIGVLTIKEFHTRYDREIPQNFNSTTMSNSSYNGSVYIPPSNSGSLYVPQTNAPLKSMGEAPKGYTPSTTASPFSSTPQQPIQQPTVNCIPIGGGGFSCR